MEKFINKITLVSSLCVLISFSAHAQILDLEFDWIKKSEIVNVFDFVQDSNGYLWVATTDGLFRYDGVEAKRFTIMPGNATTLKSNWVSALAVIGNDLWIGYHDAGLSILNLITYEISHINVLSDVEITRFYNCDSLVFIGTAKNGFTRYSKRSNRYRTINLLEFINPNYSENLRSTYNSVYGFCKSYDGGTLYLATHDGLYKYDIINDVLTSIRLTNVVDPYWREDLFHSIIQDGHAGYWIAGWRSGLNHFDPVTHQISSYRYDSMPGLTNLVVSLISKNADEIYVTTIDRGFGVFNIKKKNFRFLDYEGSISKRKSPSRVARCILKDNESNIWVGSDIGLFMSETETHRISFHEIDELKSYSYYNIRNFLKDGNSLYFTTVFANGMNRLDLKSGNVYPCKYTDFALEQDFRSIIKLGTDSLLVSTISGLLVYDKRKRIWKEFPQPPIKVTGIIFRKIIIDHEGLLWGSTNHGVYCFDFRTKQYEIYSKSNPLRSIVGDDVRDIVLDNLGNLWVGTLDQGLSYIDKKTKTVKNYLTNSRIIISSFTADHANRLWVASANGLKIFDPEKGELLTHLLSDSELHHEPTYGIVMDTAENIWVTCPKGLYRVDSRHNNFVSFETSKLGNLMDRSIGYFSLIDTTLYIGGLEGYYTLNPYTISNKRKSLKLAIKSVSVLGINLSLSGELNDRQVKLDYKQNNFTIEYGMLTLRNADMTNYAYMIDEIDAGWNNTGNRMYVNYSGLEPGKYHFKVKALEWDDIQYGTLTIVIDPPFWKTVWFLILATGLLGTIGYLGVRARIRQVRKNEQMKNEIQKKMSELQIKALQAQMNPHFIYNCLNSIDYFIVKSKPLEASDYLAKFSKLVRLFLEELNEESISLSKEIQTIDLYLQLEKLRFGKTLTYKILVDSSVEPEEYSIPSMIIQPFIENAIKHGIQPAVGGGSVIVEFFRKNFYLFCKVEDNGVGRAFHAGKVASINRKSFGINLSIQRLKLIRPKASIEVLDNMPKGTMVVISFPLK